jgi:hypothetical protein
MNISISLAIFLMTIAASSATAITFVFTCSWLKKRPYLPFITSNKTKSIIYGFEEIDAILKKQKESQHFKTEMEKNYLEGKKDGERDALEKISIQYEPVIKIKDGFFRKKVTSGYQLQIFYNGFPVGDPTVRILQNEEKVKEEHIKLIMDKIDKRIDDIVNLSARFNIQVLKNKASLLN